MTADQASIETISARVKQYGKPVLMPTEFRSLLGQLLPKSTRRRAVEKLMQQVGVVQFKTLKSDDYDDVTRISVPSLQPTPYHYALSLRGEAYLSHASAVHLLGLTQQQPKTIYVNREQSKKPQSQGTLTQEAIDRAFSRPQRRSKYAYRIDGYQIVLLSGKATGRAGVIEDPNTKLQVTCLERTLIDITVRPRYAGGVYQVSQAFRQAAGEVDSARLISLLATLDYRYPYHQALGFYLERAGAEGSVLNQLRVLGTDFNFYLDYTIADPAFDSSWRVFYPPGV